MSQNAQQVSFTTQNTLLQLQAETMALVFTAFSMNMNILLHHYDWSCVD